MSAPIKPDLFSSGNLFLDALLGTARGAKMKPERVELKLGDMLSEAGGDSPFVYFPLRSLVSVIVQMKDGAAIEVGIAGRDGMCSASVAFESKLGFQTHVVQIANSGYRVAAQTYQEAMHEDDAVRGLTLSYANYTYSAASQFAACNRLHPVEERYARWLLMAHDRVGPGEFLLTQEYSGQMLGVRRASITLIAGRLREAGLIAYDRGHIRIRDLPGLHDAACECYDIVNGEMERLMGYGVSTAKGNGPLEKPRSDGAAAPSSRTG